MIKPVMTYEQMLAILNQGGMTKKYFDEGAKSSHELYDEIQKGEASIAYNEKDGVVERFALGVKIIVEADGYELQETARLYVRNNSTVLHDEPLPAGSETFNPALDMRETPLGLRWSPLATGVRCLRKEWGLIVPKDFEVRPFVGGPKAHRRRRSSFKGTLWYDHMRYLPIGLRRERQHVKGEDLMLMLPQAHPVLVHSSKAYRGIRSRVTTAYLRLVLPRLEWENGRKLTDENVYLLLKWRPVFIPSIVADTPP